MPTIRNAAQARSLSGKRVRVEGTAQNGKLSAVVAGPDFSFPVYCLAISGWTDANVGKAVTVEGILEFTDDFTATNNGQGISQGTSGPVWVLRECRLLGR